MIELGVSEKHVDDFDMRLRAATGKHVQSVRHYKTTEPVPWSDVRSDGEKGRKIAVSVKGPGGARSTAQGQADAYFTSVAKWLGQYEGDFIYYHEPENDGTDPADFIAAYRRVVDLMRPHMPKWLFDPCFIDWTFNTHNPASKDAMKWYPGDDWVDRVTCDPYNWRGTSLKATPPVVYADPSKSDRDPKTMFEGVARVAAERKKRLMFLEFGCAHEKADTEGVKVAAWLNRFADFVEQNQSNPAVEALDAVHYFEAGVSDGRVEWAIREEPKSLQAFARLAGKTTPDPTPDPDPTPGTKTCEEKLAEIKTIVNAVAKPSKSMLKIKEILSK